MRILHTISQFPGKTGSGVFLQELFKIGREKGHTQAILAGVPREGLNEPIVGLEAFYPVTFNTPELPFDIVGMSDVMPYPSRTFSSLNDTELQLYASAFERVIHDALQTFKPDIIIANHLWLLSGYLRKLYPNIPLLCLCHGTDLRQFELAPKVGEKVRALLQGCRKIFALNPQQKATIQTRFNVPEADVIVSGSGYDPATFFFTKKPPKPPVKLLYIGKLSNAKGVPALLRAMEQLPFNKEVVELTCIGGGSGKETDAIKRHISTSSATIHALGFVPHDTLLTYLRESHIFVLPSFYEGLPLVVLEALASGLRVVCTDLPGLANFLGDEVMHQGAISYIPLPSMETIDTPSSAALPHFEQTLAHALHAAIVAELSHKSLDYVALEHSLASKTWRGLFERLEVYM
jgi:glycosyltransferase involved in cell wall biosynthesis